MIDVATAVRNASEYFKEIEESLNGSPPENLRLEEVEKSEDESYWLITLGHDVRSAVQPTPSVLRSAFTPDEKWQYLRQYKLFRINVIAGEIDSMKIRKV